MWNLNWNAIFPIDYDMQNRIWWWPHCPIFWSQDWTDLLHFQTFKKYILPFGEVKQCEHPGDEGKNFCPLCLIDVSVIAIHASGGGGGGVQLETDSFICDMTKQQSWESFSKFPLCARRILRNQHFHFFLIWLNHFYSTFLQIILYLMRYA